MTIERVRTICSFVLVSKDKKNGMKFVYYGNESDFS